MTLKGHNISRIAVVGLALGNIAFITACGPQQRTAAVVPVTPSSPSDGTQSGNGGNSSKTDTTSPAANGQTGPSTGTQSGNTVDPSLQSLAFGDVQIKVPTGWTKHAIGGSGDWGGYKLVNPSDANQQIVVVSSSCVGCYMDQSGHPDPRLVIPQTNASNIDLRTNGMAATYNVAATSGGYAGTGLVTISRDGAGYGYVEVYLPGAESALASQIIGSFAVS